MAQKKYYVTYSVMSTEAGSNPFWHAFLFLSEENLATGSIKVKNSIGHYSQDSSTTDPLIGCLKGMAGFGVDLQEGHGVLKHEEMRYMDGNGIYGSTFEVSEKKYKSIAKDLEKMMRHEEKAIQELNHELKQKGVKQNGYTRFIAEKAKAKREGREARLQPFHFTLNWMFDSSSSYTCKNRMLAFLLKHDVIDEPTFNEIQGSKFGTAFPRASNAYLAPIRLISKGDLQCHYSKRSGKVYYYSDWNNNDLYWATPIRTMSSLQDKELRKKDALIHGKLRDILNRLRAMQIRLRNQLNAIEPSDQERNKLILQEQLRRVRNAVNSFANPKENSVPECLAEKLSDAESVLTIADFTLYPKKVNYPFILMAISNAYSIHLLAGLITVTASLALIGLTPIGISIAAVATCYATFGLFGMYKKGSEFVDKRSHYENYIKQNPQYNPATEDQATDELPVSLAYS